MEFTISQIIEAKIAEWIRKGGAKIDWSTATMRDIRKVSISVGTKYSEIINGSFDFDNIIDQLPELKQVLLNLRSRVSSTTQKFIEIQNEKNNVNIKPQVAETKTDSIDNLITRISNGTALTDGSIAEKDKFLIDNQVVEHIATEACDDTIQENAELAEDAGIKTVFIRHLGTDGCCKYCEDLAGTYSSDDLPDNFWMTHDNCDCWIEYKTEKVHTKITYGRNKAGAKYKNTQNM